MKRSTDAQAGLFSLATLAGGPTSHEVAPGVIIAHMPGWMKPPDARALFEILKRTAPWEQHKIGGLSGSLLPRLTAWYGDPGASYRYSGIDNDPTPWTDRLDAHW